MKRFLARLFCRHAWMQRRYYGDCCTKCGKDRFLTS